MRAQTSLLRLALFAIAGTLLTAAPAAASALPVDVTLTKYGPSTAVVGDQLYYSLYISNDGTGAIDVTLTDDGCTPLPSDPIPLDSGASTWVYCSHTAPSSGDQYVNHACADAVAQTPPNVSGVSQLGDESCSDVTTTLLTPDLSITKTVDQETADHGATLNYTITIADTGDTRLWVNPTDQGCNTYLESFYISPGDDPVVFQCSHQFLADDGSQYVNEACADAWVQYSDRVSRSSKQDQPDVHRCAQVTTTLAQHTVSGRLYEDLNNNGGSDPGEPGVEGQIIYADLNDNGVRDEGEPFATSGSDGTYTILLDVGTVAAIRLESPAGWTCSAPVGCRYLVDISESGPPQEGGGGGQGASIDLNARVANPTGADFGVWYPGSISGVVTRDGHGVAGVLVFGDMNGNGALDVGEPAAPTGADGSYAFASLAPRTYVVRLSGPAASACTSPAPLCWHTVALASRSSADGRNFTVGQFAQIVAGAQVAGANAQLSGRTGCVRSAFRARVKGTQINSVTWIVDGFTKLIAHRPDRAGAFTLRLTPAKLSYGRHRIVAQVTFSSSSKRKPKTLRMAFARCGKQLVAPQFTG